MTEEAADQKEVNDKTQINAATPDKELSGGTDLFQNTPLPNTADEDEPRVLDPNTLGVL